MVDTVPADQFTPIRLTEVNMQGRTDHHMMQPGFVIGGYQCLKRMGYQRKFDADHLADFRTPSCNTGNHLLAVNGPAVGFDPADFSIFNKDVLNLGQLMDVYPSLIRPAGIRPDHCIMPDDPSRRMVKRPHDRVPGVIGNIDFRKHLLDFWRIQNRTVDSQRPVVGCPGRQGLHGRRAVAQGEVSLLAEHQVVIQFLGKVFIQFQTLIIEEDAFLCPVIGSQDCSISSRPPVTNELLLDDGDVGDAMVFGKVVGGRQTMGTATDDHDIIAGTHFMVIPHSLSHASSLLNETGSADSPVGIIPTPIPTSISASKSDSEKVLEWTSISKSSVR